MKTIFETNFYWKFQAPNAQQFIDKLNSVPNKNDDYTWGDACKIERTKLNWKEYAQYLTPSINIVKKNFKEEMSFILSHPWLNFYNRGFFQEVHDHGGNDLSCVFYLNDGPDFSEFYFWDRNLIQTTESWCQAMGFSTAVYPEIKAGDIIFFPSHICHGVTPHNSDVTRKTFAANLVMIPKNGQVSLEQAVKHGA